MSAVTEQLASLLSEVQDFMVYNVLERLYGATASEGNKGGPYNWQVGFHAAGNLFPERAIIAANQCVSGRQPIETPSGPIEAAEVRVGQLLCSADDRGSMPAEVFAVVRKPAEPLLRVFLSNGKWLEAAAHHRLLTTRGWRSVASCTSYRGCGSDHRRVHGEDDRRWSRTGSGSPAGCRPSARCDGGPLLLAAETGQSLAPSRAGVPALCVAGGPEDDRGDRGRHIRPHRPFDRPSILDDLDPIADQCAASAIPVACSDGRWYRGRHRAARRRRDAATPLPRSDVAIPFRPVRSGARLVAPDEVVSVVSIVGYEVLEPQVLYDFTVEPWHNYLAAGIVNHNTGKTRSAAAEVAAHLTGRYPRWWAGKRYDRPVNFIVAGRTNEDIRDIQQLALFGEIDENKSPSGKGWIPRDSIGDYSFRQCGLANVLDTIKVKHATGGWSQVTLKSYEQGSEKFQGRTIDGAWLDEEPDEFRIYTELQTRTLVLAGILMFTNTPLKGMSDIVRHFLDRTPGTWYVTAAWEDAPHIDPEEAKKLAARYPEHERETRTKGAPMMGTGLVYPVPDSMILCPPFPIPSYFRRIAAVDFGIDHPGACGWIALDPDVDITYLYDCYKISGQTPAYHAQAINARGSWIPVAWPHDGMQRDKGSGVPLAAQYRARGVNMLAEPAQWDAEYQRSKGIRAQSREAGALELLERMHTGRFKVFDIPSCRPFLEEKRMLHRKDGQIVPVNDDIESTVRYAHMMLRCARSDSDSERHLPRMQDSEYDPLASFSRRQYGLHT